MERKCAKSKGSLTCTLSPFHIITNTEVIVAGWRYILEALPPCPAFCTDVCGNLYKNLQQSILVDLHLQLLPHIYTRPFKKKKRSVNFWNLEMKHIYSQPSLVKFATYFWTGPGEFCQRRLKRPGGTNPSAVPPARRQRAPRSASLGSWRDVVLRVASVSDLPLIQDSRWEDPFMSASRCTHTAEIWHFGGLQLSRHWKHDIKASK